MSAATKLRYQITSAIALDTRAVAAAASSTPALIQYYCRRGDIEAYKLSEGYRSVWRIPLSSLEKFLTQQSAKQARKLRYPKRDAAWWRAYHDAND